LVKKRFLQLKNKISLIQYSHFLSFFSGILAGWDSFSTPDKSEVLKVFQPFGKIEFVRIEKTYGWKRAIISDLCSSFKKLLLTHPFVFVQF
jgi:hypothetical protein